MSNTLELLMAWNFQLRFIFIFFVDREKSERKIENYKRDAPNYPIFHLHQHMRFTHSRVCLSSWLSIAPFSRFFLVLSIFFHHNDSCATLDGKKRRGIIWSPLPRRKWWTWLFICSFTYIFWFCGRFLAARRFEEENSKLCIICADIFPVCLCTSSGLV